MAVTIHRCSLQGWGCSCSQNVITKVYSAYFKFCTDHCKALFKKKRKGEKKAKKKKVKKIHKSVIIAICPSCHLWFHLNVAEQRLLGPLWCLKCLVISLLYQWGPPSSAPALSWSTMHWDAVTVLACFRVLCWLWESRPENLVGAKRVALNLFFSCPSGHLWRISSLQCEVGSPGAFWK